LDNWRKPKIYWRSWMLRSKYLASCESHWLTNLRGGQIKIWNAQGRNSSALNLSKNSHLEWRWKNQILWGNWDLQWWFRRYC
jgi:hypothetical protein